MRKCFSNSLMHPSSVTKALVRATTKVTHCSYTSLYSTRPLILSRPSVQARLPLLTTRTVASTVSNKPGSQTFPHAAQNIKEETGNSAMDLAKSIAGNVFIPDTPTGQPGFVSKPSFCDGQHLIGISESLESPVLSQERCPVISSPWD
jgi:hypothetical protein